MHERTLGEVIRAQRVNKGLVGLEVNKVGNSMNLLCWKTQSLQHRGSSHAWSKTVSLDHPIP
jgi:hypothetical protein